MYPCQANQMAHLNRGMPPESQSERASPDDVMIAVLFIPLTILLSGPVECGVTLRTPYVLHSTESYGLWGTESAGFYFSVSITRIVLVASRERLVGSITVHLPSRRPGYSPVCSPRWIRGPIVCCLFSETCLRTGENTDRDRPDQSSQTRVGRVREREEN